MCACSHDFVCSKCAGLDVTGLAFAVAGCYLLALITVLPALAGLALAGVRFPLAQEARWVGWVAVAVAVAAVGSRVA